MLSNFLNNYFGFNKQQRNGLFILISMSVILLIVRLVYPLFIKPDPMLLLNLPLVERKLDSTSRNFSLSKNTPHTEQEKALHLFVFDPNTVNLDQLRELGFKEKTAQVFLKFRSKGFVFKEKKDLQKVYGIRDDFYRILEPYILIKDLPPVKSVEKTEFVKTPEKPLNKTVPARVELNSADSLSLVSLNGIGAGYAKRILKYRALLGGFISVEQLKEVYGFNDALYEKVKDYCYVNGATIKKLNLNKDDFKVLNKHPYLSYELTRSIFDWRRKTSINATNLKDILNDPTLYQKLLPYLTFE